MKLPNGYGSIYKLSGKRRRPWVARKTVGYSDKGHPIYAFIGYYEKRQEALEALAAYNANPYDLSSATFEDVYEKWSTEYFQTVSESSVKGTKAAFKLCGPVARMKIAEIKLVHLQKCVDESGKNAPTLKKLKVLFAQVFDYAVIHEIVTPDRRELVRYLDIAKAGNPNAMDRKPFSRKEINVLWKAEDEWINVILMMIYSGVRIGELLDLKKEDVNLDERWFYIKAAKTQAGIREVPIAEKVVPFFRHWLSKDSEYLICTPEGNQMTYRNFTDCYWDPKLDVLGMKSHRPHDTRHTCITLLTAAGVDERIIKQIVGHKGQGVTQVVYTHLQLPEKLEAINKIK